MSQSLNSLCNYANLRFIDLLSFLALEKSDHFV